MLKTDLKAIKIPGYSQALDITISSASLLFTDAGCVAQYDLSPTTDTTSKQPVSIANGTTTIAQVPDYVKEAHARFFKEALPGLLTGFAKPPEVKAAPVVAPAPGVVASN
jgi:hypothetical protein